MEINNFYIVGAGFDKAINWQSPLNADLLSELIFFSKDQYKLSQWRDKYKTNDIEMLLTFIDSDSKNANDETVQKDLYMIRSNIEHSLVGYFRQFRFNPANKVDWMRQFAENVLHENDAIVNLNYSCAMDGMLDCYKVWSPREGYSRFMFDTGALGTKYPSNKNDRKNIHIYKLHGSENFEETCDINNEQSTYIASLINKEIYPESALHCWLEAGAGKKVKKGYIIAPSYVKQFHSSLLYMMDETLQRIKLAKNLIIIGCGLRSEDVNIWQLLCSFLVLDYKDPQHIEKRLIIVDPNASALLQRIEIYFESQIGGFFDDKRAVSIDGCIEDSLNQLKDILLVKNEKGAGNI